MNRTEFKAQIEVLRSLKGDGALDPHGLDWMEEAFESQLPEHLPLPAVLSPTFPYAPFIGVRAEWDSNLRVDVDLKTKNSFWPGYGENCTLALDLGRTAGWDWLISRLSYLHTKQTAEQRKELK